VLDQLEFRAVPLETNATGYVPFLGRSRAVNEDRHQHGREKRRIARRRSLFEQDAKSFHHFDCRSLITMDSANDQRSSVATAWKKEGTDGKVTVRRG
jgi:hypothetical protein